MVAAKEGEPGDLAGKRILLVDDDPGVREVFAQMLSDRGARVQKSSDGFNAAWCVERFHYDAVILDMLMKYFDGFYALRAFAQLEEPPRVLVCSGFLSDEDRERVNEHAFVRGCLQKPCGEETLLDALMHVMS